MKSLIYVHGFNSSAKSAKAQVLKSIMLELGGIARFRAPNLLVYPSQAIVQLETLIIQLDSPILVGSSLGGYYATYLAEKFNLKALLINPVVLPHKLQGKPYIDGQDWRNEPLCSVDSFGELLKGTYGVQEEDETFAEDYINELANLEVAPPTDKERYKVWLKKGDNVLDYRFAKDWYKDCDVTVDDDGDHRFADFSDHFLKVLDWAELTK